MASAFDSHIDPEHQGEDRQILNVFYDACMSEGGTADEIHLQGIRAVLAARLAPQPPAEGEVAELVEDLRRICFDIAAWDADTITRAAELLQQQHPTPVPVSERLPGPEDCDAEGKCWIHMPDIGTAPSWRLVDPREIGPYHTHWAAARALPLPQGEVK